ncbi:threonine ammonia-lyase [Ktedonospora formicarum]|uniref:threonine ammonia-lyase n=1 Tax=Ktedonospora formicarum TaxID=2778364 RepID=A0A8J3MWT8_9CHLR|nr:threonine ammonia-lyase [Ktedonospora formicarum]GHO47915.1 threonine ammonia-lyase [Ktedonospora formicarum]
MPSRDKQAVAPQNAPEAEPTQSEAAPSIAFADIWQANQFLHPLIEHTPMIRSRELSTLLESEVHLKLEQMQRGGSFKVRGATYKLSRLPEEQRKAGVITASAGNHAQGVAIAATSYGIPCTIVVPENASLTKVTASQNYGATVIQAGATYDDAVQRCTELQQELGATYIPAFDDIDVVTGQGTLGLEMLNEVPSADTIVVPIGGGGLIAGIAIAARAMKPSIKIIGVEAEGAASMRASIRAGKLTTLPALATIADGIAIKQPGKVTFPLIQKLVDDIVLVSDEQIIEAALFLMEKHKVLVEGAGAAGVAALMSNKLQLAGKHILTPLTGGNIDTNLLGRFAEHGLIGASRYFGLHASFPDRPGELARMLNIIAGMRVNVIDVHYQHVSRQLPFMQHEAIITLETRNRLQCEELLRTLSAAGFTVEEAQALTAPVPPTL